MLLFNPNVFPLANIDDFGLISFTLPPSQLESSSYERERETIHATIKGHGTALSTKVAGREREREGERERKRRNEREN